MALYTLLIKISEDEQSVRYRFGPNEHTMGVVELDKPSGVVREIEPVPGIATYIDLSNARKQLFRLLTKGDGFPETTAYEA